MHKSDRAGVLARQGAGYSAFIPKSLPPDPPLALGGKIADLEASARHELGKLDGALLTLPDADLFVEMYIRKEVVFSSQIEGTQSSLADLLEAEAEIFNPTRPRDIKEVMNYHKALGHGFDEIRTAGLSVDLIEDLHVDLLAGLRGGRRRTGTIRTEQTWIGPRGSSIFEAMFVPPPPHEIAHLLDDLVLFLRRKGALPELIQIGIVHSQFETIHPFVDGNGRIGRLLIVLLLCEHGLLSKPALYISYYLKRRRAEYYRCLQSVRDNGDWEGWLVFFLDTLASAATGATDAVSRIAALRERDRRRIAETFGRTTANGLRVLDALYVHPIISVKRIAEITGVSFQAANQLTTRFVEQGILAEITGWGRNRRFSYTAYVSIFSD